MNPVDINVFLLENRPVIRDALEGLLRGVFHGEFAHHSRYEDLPKKIPDPSLVLMAVHLLPADAPIPFAKEGLATVVYAENFTPNCAAWWIDRGAMGVWDLRDSFESVQEGLLGTLRGEVLKSECVKKVLNGSTPKFGMHLLSKRELQVAIRLVQGKSTRDVAKELGVTEGTIKNQRKSVYRKLGIVRSSQLPQAMGNGYAALRK